MYICARVKGQVWPSYNNQAARPGWVSQKTEEVLSTSQCYDGKHQGGYRPEGIQSELPR